MDQTIKWWSMPVGKQIANAGGELSRAIRQKKKGNIKATQEYCIKAVEMLAYTKLDPKNVQRRMELTFAQEELVDYLLGENYYGNDDESIMKWYNAFL